MAGSAATRESAKSSGSSGAGSKRPSKKSKTTPSIDWEKVADEKEVRVDLLVRVSVGPARSMLFSMYRNSIQFIFNAGSPRRRRRQQSQHPHRHPRQHHPQQQPRSGDYRCNIWGIRAPHSRATRHDPSSSECIQNSQNSPALNVCLAKPHPRHVFSQCAEDGSR